MLANIGAAQPPVLPAGEVSEDEGHRIDRSGDSSSGRGDRLSIILARSQVADELPRMFPTCPRGILARKGGCRGDDMVWGGFDRRCPGLFGFLRSARSTDCVARDRRRESRRLQAGPGARTAAPTSRESCVVGLLHRASAMPHTGATLSGCGQGRRERSASVNRAPGYERSQAVAAASMRPLFFRPCGSRLRHHHRWAARRAGHTLDSERAIERLGPYGIPVRSRQCWSVALWWAVEDFLAQ